MDWIAQNWPDVALALSLLIVIKSALEAVSTIRDKGGGFFSGLYNLLFKRKVLREQQRAKEKAVQQSLKEINTSMSQVKEAVDQIERNTNLNRRINMSLLRSELQHLTERALKRGYEYPEEIDEINAKYELYTACGGNGAIASRVNRVRNLPLRHRTEPWEIGDDNGST